MIYQLFAVLAVFAQILRVQALDEPIYCNATSQCPEEYPCCSSFGQCGTGQYCVNSCNPKYSFSVDSCVAMPICKDISTKFNNNYTSKVLDANTYLGNASAGDWTYNGYLVDYPQEDGMLLTMPKYSGGSVLSSTRYMWYGKMSAKIKSSHLAGVVSAFIMFSNVQDEVDFEFVGTDLETVQTNYYFQGILNYTNSANLSASNTFENFHTYEVDWHPDYITWSIDGVVGRTLYKNSTYNETSGEYEFPQTPAKVQLSIWPGGNSTNAPGTIAWAGGAINWDAPDIQDPGYYYMVLQEANITCYDPPAGATINGSKSYIFTDKDNFTEDSVVISDRDYVLANSGADGAHLGISEIASSSMISSSTQVSSTFSSSTVSSSTVSSSTVSSSTVSSSVSSSMVSSTSSVQNITSSLGSNSTTMSSTSSFINSTTSSTHSSTSSSSPSSSSMTSSSSTLASSSKSSTVMITSVSSAAEPSAYVESRSSSPFSSSKIYLQDSNAASTISFNNLGSLLAFVLTLLI
ncbi:putative glycosidase CRH2 [Nakaseomyces bracarensis]|uniref:Crh-like protein n=1 Tax=Nakaseomyces bracarensis TaxID=273131 RepID=A0ABR4NNC5_9SACH